MKRLLDLLRAPEAPLIGALSAFVLGVLTIVLSLVLGIGTVQDGTGRQVGYLWALNWSITLPLLLPVLLYLVLSLYQISYYALEELVDRKMVVDGEGRLVREQSSVMSAYERPLRIFLGAWLVVSLLLTGYSAHQLYADSWRPIDRHLTQQDLSEADVEVDWAVASVLEPEEVSQAENKLFTAVVYLVAQPLGYSAIVFFALLVSTFMFFVYGLGSSYRDLALIPSPRGRDPRFGFEVFGPFGRYTMGSAVCILVAMYLVVVTNYYINVGFEDAKSLIGGLIRPYRTLDLGTLITPLSLDASTGLAILVALMVVALPSLFVVWILDSVADAAANRLELLLDRESFTTQLNEDELHRLQSARSEIVTWPFEWLSLNRALAGVVFALGGIFVFRLFPALFASALTTLVAAFVVKLRKKARGEMLGAG